MCLSILTKWDGESPGSSSISRLTSEAKNLLANCEVELEARDATTFCAGDFGEFFCRHFHSTLTTAKNFMHGFRRRVEREAMERIALMVELEGWVREAQDRLDAELGAIMAVGKEQRSYLKKESEHLKCTPCFSNLC